MGVSLVWEVRSEVESLAISPSPSAGSVAVDVPVGGNGSWHVRATGRFGPNEVWQSSRVIVALAAQDWIAALAARPAGLPVPEGDCSLPDGWRGKRVHRVSDHYDGEAGKLSLYGVQAHTIECPGWAEPLVALDWLPGSTAFAHCGLPDTAQRSKPHADWVAWAEAHPTADGWCWDDNQRNADIWFLWRQAGGHYDMAYHYNDDHGHDQPRPRRSIRQD